MGGWKNVAGSEVGVVILVGVVTVVGVTGIDVE